MRSFHQDHTADRARIQIQNVQLQSLLVYASSLCYTRVTDFLIKDSKEADRTRVENSGETLGGSLEGDQVASRSYIAAKRYFALLM